MHCSLEGIQNVILLAFTVSVTFRFLKSGDGDLKLRSLLFAVREFVAQDQMLWFGLILVVQAMPSYLYRLLSSWPDSSCVAQAVSLA